MSMSTRQTVAEKPTLASTTKSWELFQAGRVTTISAEHAIHDTSNGFLPSLLPVFKETLLLSNAQAGSLLQPLIGYLSDRVRLRILFILALAVTATMMSLLGVAPSYAVMADVPGGRWRQFRPAPRPETGDGRAAIGP